MDIKTIKLLATYNAATNERMGAIFARLSQGQWERKFQGFFNSIRSMCNHIYIADFTWLKRFSKLRKFAYIENPIFKKNIKFDEMVIGPVKEYISMRNELDNLVNRFADELNQEALDKDLDYQDSRGTEHRKNFGGLILHMFNHQTHHRGMISLYLEAQGIENDYSNLTEIL